MRRLRLVRAVAVITVAVATVALAVVMVRSGGPAPGDGADRAAATGATEIRRCRALGTAAQDDAACHAAWRAARRLFLRSEEGRGHE